MKDFQTLVLKVLPLFIVYLGDVCIFVAGEYVVIVVVVVVGWVVSGRRSCLRLSLAVRLWRRFGASCRIRSLFRHGLLASALEMSRSLLVRRWRRWSWRRVQRFLAARFFEQALLLVGRKKRHHGDPRCLRLDDFRR